MASVNPSNPSISTASTAGSALRPVRWSACLFWGLASLGLALAAASTFLDLARPWFGPILAIRMVGAFTAAMALAWEMSGNRMWRWAPSVFALGIWAIEAYRVSLAGAVTPGFNDFGGLLFLASAALFRGPLPLFWGGMLPTSALLFAISVTQTVGPFARFSEVMAASLIPMLSLAGGALLVAVRGTRSGAKEAREELARLSQRNRRMMNELRSVESDMKNLLSLVRVITRTDNEETLTAELATQLSAQIEAAVGTQGAIAGEAGEYIESVSDARVTGSRQTRHQTHHQTHHSQDFDSGSRLDPIDIYQILKEAVSEVRSILPTEARVSLILTGPEDIAVPMASVRGDREELRSVFRSLLAQAVDACGGNNGVVRVGFRLGLSHLSLVFEDNGHGLGEAMILKMEAKGSLVRNARLAAMPGRILLSEVRRVVEASGGRMEMIARLGVGARVALDLPRVDAFARTRAQGEERNRRLRDFTSPKAQSDSSSRHA